MRSGLFLGGFQGLEHPSLFNRLIAPRKRLQREVADERRRARVVDLRLIPNDHVVSPAQQEVHSHGVDAVVKYALRRVESEGDADAQPPKVGGRPAACDPSYCSPESRSCARLP